MAREYISRERTLNRVFDLIESRLEWKSDARGEIQGLNAAYCAIEDIPAADVTPVVRCRDCRWRHDDSYPMWLPCVEVETDPDWFCADGERREVQDGN